MGAGGHMGGGGEGEPGLSVSVFGRCTVLCAGNRVPRFTGRSDVRTWEPWPLAGSGTVRAVRHSPAEHPAVSTFARNDT